MSNCFADGTPTEKDDDSAMFVAELGQRWGGGGYVRYGAPLGPVLGEPVGCDCLLVGRWPYPRGVAEDITTALSTPTRTFGVFDHL